MDFRRANRPLANSKVTRQAGTDAHPIMASSSKLRSNSRKAGRQTATGPIEQAVALKASLLQSLNQTNELIRTLKRHKKQSRLVASTLKSLKELQQAGWAGDRCFGTRRNATLTHEDNIWTG